MANVHKICDEVPRSRKTKPAMTPEGRENQLIALAIDTAEDLMRSGKASSQIICHYLKLASSKEKLEKELLEKEVELATAKADAIKSAQRSEELYKNALAAMRSYQGSHEDEEEKYCCDD